MSDVRERIEKLIADNPVLLFMKGTPQFPQCGFSGRVVQILDYIGAPVVGVNVLEDAEIRQGIKEYANWPTVPQLYVKGEFVGGADIVSEMFQSGELALNDYGRVGRLSILAMKIAFSVVGTQWAYQGFSDAHTPESWSPQLRLVEETSLSHAPEVELYPPAARLATRLMGMTKSGARTARILRYRF